MGDPRENYRTVRGELEHLRLSIGDPPPHLVWRLVALLGDETLRHIDSDLSPTTSPRLCSGSVVAFTDSRVVCATVLDGPVQHRPQDGETFSVRVETWSRAALRRLEMAPEKEPGWRNSDGGWSNLFGNELGRPEGPTDMAVKLEYDQRPAITLPLPGQSLGLRTGMLFDFLPALLADVSSAG